MEDIWSDWKRPVTCLPGCWEANFTFGDLELNELRLSKIFRHLGESRGHHRSSNEHIPGVFNG